MHAIERPYLPRIGVLTLGAVLLAVVVLLLAASRVGDVGLSSGIRRKRNRLTCQLREIFQWQGPRFPPHKMLERMMNDETRHIVF